MSDNSSSSESSRAEAREFRTTHWSVLLGAASTAFGAANPPINPLDITLTALSTYTNGAPFNRVAAKSVIHDPITQRLYVANERDTRIDVLDIHNPTQPTQVAVIDLAPYAAVVNSVALHSGVIAVAMQNAVKASPGSAVFFDSNLLVPELGSGRRVAGQYRFLTRRPLGAGGQ